MSSKIQKYLHVIRKQQANLGLHSGFLQLLNIVLPILFLFLILEVIFYFETGTREKTVILISSLIAVSAFYLLARWLINLKGWFGNATDEAISELIGQKTPDIADRLLNAHQLQQSIKPDSIGADLAQQAINRIIQRLHDLAPHQLRDKISKKLLVSISVMSVIVVISFLIFQSGLLPALNRILHPKTEFSVPLPFSLISQSGRLDVLGGDSISVSISGTGELPDSVKIFWQTRGKNRAVAVPQKSNIYAHQFDDVNSNIVYWAEYHSTSWFTPWEVISTNPDTIYVTDRPVVEELLFTIIPPAYTGEKLVNHPGNITDVTALSGSRIKINAQATKPLEMAWCLIGDQREMLNVVNQNISGSFTLRQDEIAAIYCLDFNNVGNLNPPQYRFTAIPDLPPELLISQPDREIELDESLEIYFNIQVSDDYGFSNAKLLYNIVHPDYVQPDTTIYERAISEIVDDARSQQIFHSWELSDLDLSPEDELRFSVIVADNNTLTGPSATKSAIFIARYPSLEDLFMALEDSEQSAEMEAEEIMMSLEDVKELVEELELDLRKSEEVNWEQTQKTEEVMQQMDEIVQQIEDLQKSMEQISEQIEKNDLVNDSLQEKFSKLQELLDSIMTPELMEAMEKMRQAMEEMDHQQLQQALENLDFNMEEMEEQLDRFIEMFEQAMAEQKMDEVIKRLEEMLQEQTDIVSEMNFENSESLTELAKRERRQEEKFSNLLDSMEDASEALENVAQEQSEDLQQLKDSELAKETADNLTDARKKMQQSNSSCNKPAGEAEQNLSEMLDMAQSIQKQFQDQTVAEMIEAFQRVLQNTLSISQRQEGLRRSSKDLRSRSPRLKETAGYQDKIRRQTTQLFAQLTELSKKTFYITPKIGRSLGKAQSSMEKSIAQLEQNRVGSALTDQKTAMEGLNEAAKRLLNAMNQMQSSGSASGFESFLEQMQQMSEQQQGINQGTMQMGQMGMMAQQQMMQRLQAQQQALKNALEEMLGEMTNDEMGGMGKAAEEMEDVIKDFKRRQVTRKTHERQERILSRMLDSQKSLTQRDYSKKRKSKTGEEFIYTGPAGLPTGLGEREILLIKAMEDALNEGYSREYQNMMKTYFRQLQKETETSAQTDENG